MKKLEMLQKRLRKTVKGIEQSPHDRRLEVFGLEKKLLGRKYASSVFSHERHEKVTKK